MRLPTTFLDPEAIGAFPDDARRAVYEAIALRRDVRHFRTDLDVEPEVLERILEGAHQAPSVGLSQPWGFVLVRERAVRERIRQSFVACRESEARRFPAARRDAYLAHKLEGILEAPLNICVAVDLRDRDEAILGTTVQPEAVRASACCAVENLWLAARAEGIGVGWVSIVEPAVLRAELALPAGVEPVAYLCVGHPVAFRERPMLEETRWRKRRPLAEVVHPRDRWEERDPQRAAPSAPLSPPVRGPSRYASPEGVRIAPFDDTLRAATREHSKRLTKPTESLGRLEDLAAWYAGARGVSPMNRIERATLALFVADHGVVVEGVSAYGSQVTAAMIANVMAGGAAINALARQAGADIALVDVGVAGDLSAVPTRPVISLLRRSIRAGTGNMRRERAMRQSDVEAALLVGTTLASNAVAQGADVVLLGEMGIGNTTAAAALTSALLGAPPRDVVGPGTGIGNDVVARKVAVVEDALALHQPDPNDPLDVLCAVGGLEIAALVGCALEAARHRVPILLDGYVTNAAALVAAAMDPGIVPFLLASHASPEPGARIVLDHLRLAPLFDLGLRLGEGTGAALALPVLRSAVDVHLSMATFATAGIVGRVGSVCPPGDRQDKVESGAPHRDPRRGTAP
ncbi:MAG TPA: nicotinate-nucleotide--dimethylbenzimidazole phosphoribosyltransferase [Polyangiaceae bacterium]|jgi:nicotinate-nucleotide--dimethylbenzimidazole phosphoribosyltransferase|nr:nicotinate-nucleotide--dimethylbenzimidazole phosphoribosyltransferase [Polyangiaceae bacterium]